MLPLLVVAATGLLVLILDPFTSPAKGDRLAILSLAGVGGAALVLVEQHGASEIVFGGMLAADGFAWFCNLLFLLVAGLTF
jgi:NADH:ubiquinone oxidoreductase subunit 2 (subunit N)